MPPAEQRSLALTHLMRFFCVLALLVAGRLALVMVLNPEHYDNPTQISYHRRTVLPAEKGALLDRCGRVLARCVELASVTANPQMIKDPVATARALAPMLEQSEDELLTLLKRRWRRVLLRRDVPQPLAARLAKLVEQGVVTFSDEPREPVYSVWLYPRQFGPGPAERERLAVLLGLRVAELDRVLTSTEPAVRAHDHLDATTAKRLEQLSLPGLVVQENPAQPTRVAWLMPVEAAIELVDTGENGRAARIRPAVWEALTPLWNGAPPPNRAALEARFKAPFVYLQRQLPLALADAVQAKLETAHLTGIEVHREFGREYPQGRVGHMLLGRCDVDTRGVSGLEALYNQILDGVDGYRKVTVNAKGKPIIQEREDRQLPLHGKNLELTLDSMVQGYAEEAVAGAVDEFDGDWGLAVVVDPRNGEILAMADYASPVHGAADMNRCMSVSYEPGSVMKPLVVAAALEEHVVTPNDAFYCNGRCQVGGRTLSCIKTHGPETTYGAVRDSCNMALIQIGARLGQEKLEPYFRKYGLLGRTGLALEANEASGNIFTGNPDGRWGLQKTATVSYGKGVATTAVGIVRAYCALINGGNLPNLHLVRRILDRDGQVVVEQPSDPGPRVLSEDTTAKVREMLHAVVNDQEGTGRIAGSTLYEFAGKTGTSVAYSSNDHRVVSFIGYGPYKDPRLLTLVSVCEPRVGHRWGGSTCGAAFRFIMDSSLQYMGVPPKEGATNPVPKEPVAAPTTAAPAPAAVEPAEEAAPPVRHKAKPKPKPTVKAAEVPEP